MATTLEVMEDQFPVFRTLSKSFPVHGCHRGGSGDYGPENTMYNYRRSVFEFGTQLLEIDFRLTKDGEVVLIHNDATTNGSGPVSSFTMEELRKLDAAWEYPELRGQGITIPTFKEFLDEFLPVENLVFMLDFKDEQSIRRVVEIVTEYAFWDRVILGAVPPSCNALLASLKPATTPIATDASTTTAMTLGHYSGMISFCNMTKHDIFGFLLFPGTSHFWRQSLVNAIHSCKKPIIICGADTEEEQKQSIDWGVDIILTNNPAILRHTLDKYKAKEESK